MADNPQMNALRIERMAYGADAIAHAADGKVVFVRGGAPGDVVDAEILQDGPKSMRARVTRVIEAGPARAVPKHDLTGLGDACPWAHLSREAQLEAKRGAVVDSLVRIGRFDAEEAERLVDACESVSDDWGYRNKVELAFERRSGRARLGMHDEAAGGIVAITSCPLLPKRHAKLPKSVSGALSYLANSNQFDLERIGIRVSERTRDLEIALWGPAEGFPRAQAAKVLSDAAKATSIVRVLTKGPAKARKVVSVERLSGAGSWEELVGQERMRFSAPSFFQVNTKGAERLVELALDGLECQADDEALDLYCGAGTFTLPLARRVGFVEAVESAGSAVRDLRRNLQTAGIDNVEALGGDAARELANAEADIAIVDPPRAGLAKEAVDGLCALDARAIAYVSCDPATLARDLARFREIGVFEPCSITPVDLFPQTFHVETVTILRRATLGQ